jgi:hypothetical protein
LINKCVDTEEDVVIDALGGSASSQVHPKSDAIDVDG